MLPNDQKFTADSSSRLTGMGQFSTAPPERQNTGVSYHTNERMTYAPADYNRINTGGSLAYPSSQGYNKNLFEKEFNQSSNFTAPTPQQYPSAEFRSALETPSAPSFVPRSKYLNSLTSNNTAQQNKPSAPMQMNMNFQNMAMPQPQSYESKHEISK